MALALPAETFSIADIQSALDTGEDPLDLKTEAGYAMLAVVKAALELRDAGELDDDDLLGALAAFEA